MNKIKAEKLIRRKASRVKKCPFCGQVPKVSAYCDTQYSAHGSWGHYARREACCKATGLGQTALFFCNNWKKPNYSLWWNMFSLMINDWNTRKA